MLNGVTDLICTKSDVLSGLGQIPVCHSYEIDGTISDKIPYSLVDANINPQYQNFEGWTGDLGKIKNYNDLPETFKTYMQFVEEQIGLKVNTISVGPDRDETIVRA
jgi:adenylosuccinate synthase